MIDFYYNFISINSNFFSAFKLMRLRATQFDRHSNNNFPRYSKVSDIVALIRFASSKKVSSPITDLHFAKWNFRNSVSTLVQVRYVELLGLVCLCFEFKSPLSRGCKGNECWMRYKSAQLAHCYSWRVSTPYRLLLETIRTLPFGWNNGDLATSKRTQWSNWAFRNIDSHWFALGH